MNAKTLFAALVLILGFLAASSPGFAQAPPESPKAKQMVALVDKAALLIDSKGKSVFPEFRKPGSEWRSGDTYLFVTDMKGRNLVNGAFPKFEGTDTSSLKDAKGKPIVQDQIEVARFKGSGWVDYMWPKPGQSEPSQKSSYVRAVKIDGEPGYVGAGSIHSSVRTQVGAGAGVVAYRRSKVGMPRFWAGLSDCRYPGAYPGEEAGL